MEPTICLENLFDYKFRLNPLYRLLSFANITIEEQKRYGLRQIGHEMYGLLIPKSPFLLIKAVKPEIINLLECITKSSSFPKDADRYMSIDKVTIYKLILDAVIEVETKDGFISGASIGNIINLNKTVEYSYCNNLSIESLRYGESLNIKRAPELSARMYFYNRIPASPRLTNLILNHRDYINFLGLYKGSRTYDILLEKWIKVRQSPDNPGWISWRSKFNHHKNSKYKLYISPIFEDVNSTLDITIPVITELGIPAFKIGLGLHGILRPDKIILYIPTYEKLFEVIDILRQRLSSTRAHGIPFTGLVDEEGLLSWGMDPPRNQVLLRWQGTSWRRWITDCLSAALLTAKGSNNHKIPPWKFALQRIALEGINTETWTPINTERMYQ